LHLSETENLKPGNAKRLAAQQALAEALIRENQPEEAADLYGQIYNVCRRTYGPEKPTTVAAGSNYAIALYAIGRSEEATELQAQMKELQSVADSWRKLSGTNPADKLCLGLSAMGKFHEAGGFQDELRGLRREVYGPDHYSTKSAENHFAFDEFGVKREISTAAVKEVIITVFKGANRIIDERRAEAAAYEEALTLASQDCVRGASEAIIGEIGSDAANQTDVGSDAGDPSVAESGGGKWWWPQEPEPWRLEDVPYIAPASEDSASEVSALHSTKPFAFGGKRDAQTPSTAVPWTPAGHESTMTSSRGFSRPGTVSASRGAALNLIMGPDGSRPPTKAGRDGVPEVPIPGKEPDEIWRIQTEMPPPPPPGSTPRAVMDVYGFWW
jgi:hypothetical protein